MHSEQVLRTHTLHAVVFLSILVALSLSACKNHEKKPVLATVLDPPRDESLARPGEIRLANIRQLTRGGENAEAYFGPRGTEIIFQATRDGFECDQIFRMDLDGRNKRLVSTGEGRTTCAFIFPNQPKILYSSTHAELDACPPRPDYSRGYVWRLQPELDIYVAGPDGQDPTALAPHPGYDAEGVISPRGDRILFTSTRSGDVDIFSMAADGSDIKQLTDEVGYDGGAFFSLDGSKIVYRAHHPEAPEALEEYKDLLAEDLVRPSVMELFVMDADGSNKRQITSNGAANFAPYFHPDGERVIFSSNMDDPAGRNFDLYMIGIDGKNLERITYEESFDSFPMFSYDGSKLIFSSNRNAKKDGETNVFVADWVENTPVSIAARMRGQAQLDQQTYMQRVEALAAPKMEGRGVGTKGLDLAADYIARQFAIAGLVSPEGMTDYRQPFEVPIDLDIKRAELASSAATLTSPADFRPAPFSSSGETAGEVVYLGHGVRAPELGHDDYATIAPGALEGKIALVLSGAPDKLGADHERHTNLATRAIHARTMGARAILLVTDEPEGGAHATHGVISSANILSMHVSRAAANKILSGALDRPSRVGQSLGEVTLAATLENRSHPVQNIVGRLPARKDGAPTQRALIIGAHFDHLGYGGEGSLRPEESVIHPGADDNASGVALMLELAESLALIERTHDVYFIAFNGEESGLLGSDHFVEHAPIAPEYMIAMLNFDMVGALDQGALNVSGVGSAREFLDLVRRVHARTANTAALDLALGFEGYGPSDHMSFYTRDVPVLSFFTGLHGRYHTPDDVAEEIDAVGAMRIGVFAFELAAELIVSERAPTFVADSVSAHTAHGAAKKDRGYGPYFGSIPGFGQGKDVRGALLMGAQPGSPAESAGIEKGDVLVKFGAQEVTSLRDFAVALRAHAPGDVVEVVVIRDGERVVLEATLGEKEKK